MQFPTYEPVFPRESKPVNESEIPAPVVPRELRDTKGPRTCAVNPFSARPDFPSNAPVPFALAEPPPAPPANGFQKDDSVKAPLAMLPFEALAEVAKVMHYGAYLAPRPDGTKGYGRDNWRLCDDPERYESAEFRHYAAVQRGEAKDADSGLLHRAHKACDALFALQIELDKIRRGQ